MPKNWSFWIVALKKILESPLPCKEIKKSLLKEINPAYSLKDWCWNWSSSTVGTWREELIHWQRACCWENLKAEGKWQQRMRWLDGITNSVVVQSLSHVWLFAVPWTAACQASLSFTISSNLLTLMSIESVMLSNHLILCYTLILLSLIFPSFGVFSNESALPIRWPK